MTWTGPLSKKEGKLLVIHAESELKIPSYVKKGTIVIYDPSTVTSSIQ